jgi:hypothetical protein
MSSLVQGLRLFSTRVRPSDSNFAVFSGKHFLFSRPGMLKALIGRSCVKNSFMLVRLHLNRSKKLVSASRYGATTLLCLEQATELRTLLSDLRAKERIKMRYLREK